MHLRHRLNLVCQLCFLFAIAVGGTFLNSVHFAAHAARASITFSATAGPPTSNVTINGIGYASTQKLELRMDKTVQLGSVTTDATGAFSAGITIPATSLPGHHTLFAASVQAPFISSHAGFLVQSDWPEFGYDSQHTNSNPYENVLSPANVSGLVLAWSERIGPLSTGIESSVVVGNGIAYMATYGDKIYAYNATTGALLFFVSAKYHRHIYGSPATLNGLLYMGSSEGDLIAFNARTGAYTWINYAEDGFISSPIISNNILFITAYNNHLFAINATTGALLWRYYGVSVSSSPTANNNVVYAISGNDRRIIAFDATTGTRLWYSRKGNYYGSPLVANGKVYIASNGSVIALNATTGAFLWHSTTVGGYGSVTAIAGNILYTSSSNGIVSALDATTGASLWTYTIGGSGSLTTPLVANGVLYVSMGNTLYALNTTTGASLWSYSNGYWFTSPTVVNGMLYAGMQDSSGYHVDAFHLPNPAH
jgi:outer membrane protein assembly factor BamB